MLPIGGMRPATRSALDGRWERILSQKKAVREGATWAFKKKFFLHPYQGIRSRPYLSSRPKRPPAVLSPKPRAELRGLEHLSDEDSVYTHM